jgi:hypothetical protein
LHYRYREQAYPHYRVSNGTAGSKIDGRHVLRHVNLLDETVNLRPPH